MKANKLRSKKTLPDNFQEVLITHEMQFEKGIINLDIIRKLIYLYSVTPVNSVRYGVL
jgi:hypothetical protein